MIATWPAMALEDSIHEDRRSLRYVSSERQAQNATIESQLAALKDRANADRHHFGPDDIFIDDGYSGSTLNRPALERLRDRVAEGRIDVVYVHNPDRLARRYAYQVLLLDEFRSHGVEVVFLTNPPGTGAEESLLVQMQGIMAEYERTKIIERYRRGKLHRARTGSVNPLSGAPYGYRYVRKTETESASYEVLEEEASVVRSIFEAFVHEQRSLGDIVRTLNGEGVPTRRGAPRWDRSTVWGVLRNPAYKGAAAYGKTEATERGPALRAIRSRASNPRRRKSTYRDRPPDQWITIPVPALVSDQVFAAATEQLERNRRRTQGSARGQRYLLQGLIVCAKCHYAYYGKLVSRSAAKGQCKWSYYRCVGSDAYRFGGKRVCNNAQMRVDQLDGYVWESVCAFLQDPRRVTDEWTRRMETDTALTALESRRDEAARILSEHEKTLRRLLDAYEAGAIELGEFTKRSARVKQRVVRVQSELTITESELQGTKSLRSVVTHLESFAERVRSGIEGLTWIQRRDLIRQLVARVEVDEDGATIVYRVPPTATDNSASPAGEGKSSPGMRGPDAKSFPRCWRRAWTTLRRPLAPFDEHAIHHHPALEEAADQAQDAFIGDVARNSAHQRVVIRLVEEFREINVNDDPPSSPHVTERFPQGAVRTATRSESVTMRRERRIDTRLQYLQQRLLNTPIDHCRDTHFQLHCAAASSWDGPRSPTRFIR